MQAVADHLYDSDLVAPTKPLLYPSEASEASEATFGRWIQAAVDHLYDSDLVVLTKPFLYPSAVSEASEASEATFGRWIQAVADHLHDSDLVVLTKPFLYPPEACEASEATFGHWIQAVVDHLHDPVPPMAELWRQRLAPLCFLQDSDGRCAMMLHLAVPLVPGRRHPQYC